MFVFVCACVCVCLCLNGMGCDCYLSGTLLKRKTDRVFITISSQCIGKTKDANQRSQTDGCYTVHLRYYACCSSRIPRLLTPEYEYWDTIVCKRIGGMFSGNSTDLRVKEKRKFSIAKRDFSPQQWLWKRNLDYPILRQYSFDRIGRTRTKRTMQ